MELVLWRDSMSHDLMTALRPGTMGVIECWLSRSSQLCLPQFHQMSPASRRLERFAPLGSQLSPRSRSVALARLCRRRLRSPTSGSSSFPVLLSACDQPTGRVERCVSSFQGTGNEIRLGSVPVHGRCGSARPPSKIRRARYN
ncbi:hypothetical protein OH77DRAFT_606710 [Trametes cingulata]|nr:hypothetical protein OH77DRAFT_606710 [Trametes cingulata]